MSDERWALGVERLKDGNMNSRGLLSPRYYIVSAYRGRLKDAYRQPLLLVPVFQTDLLSRYIFHGFKNPRLFALRASRLSDGFSFIANHSPP
jgi:hypothetical protein